MMSLWIYSFGGFAASLGIGLALTPLVIRVALSMGLVDQPGGRKIHRTPVPRVGGVGIALAALFPFAVAILMYGSEHPSAVEPFAGPLITLLASSVCVLILGLIDDVLNIRAKYKLIVLLAVSVMFCGSGGAIKDIVWDGHTLFHLRRLMSWPLTILWLVGITVSVNFIDGLDGLAAGIVAIGCGVAAVVSASAGYPIGVLLSLCLMGALVGFLFFNFNPAKIFMGDCGSMFIGFLLAGSCALASGSIGTTRGLILPALALSIPLLDTLLTFVRRSVLHRQSLFAAERGHIHHRLLDIGLQTRHAVLFLYAVTLAAAGVAMISLVGNPWATAMVAIGYCLLLVVLIRMAGSVRARETLTAIRRNRAIASETNRYQNAFADLQVEFRDAKTFDSWWKQVCKAADKLEFNQLQLPLTRRDGSKNILRWRRTDTELADGQSITADVPLPQRRMGETMRISVEVAASMFLENAGQRVALFSRLMGEFGLDRLLDNAPGRESANTDLSVNFNDTASEPEADTASTGLFPNLRVAIVHDFLYTYAGAERVVEQLVALFPQADIFSLFDFLPPHLRGFIRGKTVTTSFIQTMPFARKRHRAYLPLMPLAIEQIDVSAYDVVISSSYLVAKGVLTRPDQLHICYCHTPVRFAWDLQNQYLAQNRKGLLAAPKAIIARLILHYIRSWDLRSAHGVDVFVTNSDFVGRRVSKLYRRDATTIYPPVDTDRFTLCEEKEDFFLTASRLVPYKRIDLIVEAFAQMPDRRLVVIGEGPEMEKIKSKATSNIRLVGYQPPDRLRQYMQRAKAFVFAAEEDFGITPVEAQACGTPVIAFGRGGVTESVLHGQTGLLFTEQTVESLCHAVKDFDNHDWDAVAIRKNAERFSIRQFRENFVRVTKVEWAAFLANRIQKGRATQPTLESLLDNWPGMAEQPNGFNKPQYLPPSVDMRRDS